MAPDSRPKGLRKRSHLTSNKGWSEWGYREHRLESEEGAVRGGYSEHRSEAVRLAKGARCANSDELGNATINFKLASLFG